MKISVNKFIADFQSKKIVNSKINPTAIEDTLKEMLEVKTYLPFKTKQSIAKAIVDKNVSIVNGYKIVDSTAQFLSFVTAMLVSHTALEINDPYEDYDALCEAKLLQPIIETFREDYDSCDILLKLALSDKMQDNTTPAIVAEFLDKISSSLGDFSGLLKEKLGEFNLDDIVDVANINTENLSAIKQILNK